MKPLYDQKKTVFEVFEFRLNSGGERHIKQPQPIESGKNIVKLTFKDKKLHSVEKSFTESDCDLHSYWFFMGGIANSIESILNEYAKPVDLSA